MLFSLVFGVLYLALPQSAALLAIPDNVRVDSEIAFITVTKSTVYSVEEFIGKRDGNVNIKVSTKANEPQDKNEITSYHRINEASASFETPTSDSIVAYSESDRLCRKSSTNDQWLLKYFSNMLSLIFKSEGIQTEDVEKDRTAIGPTALLRIFATNANKFTLSAKAFDEARLRDMYYFESTISINNTHQATIVCSLPKSGIQSDVKVGTTLLADIVTSAHISAISITLFDKDSERPKLNPQDFYKLLLGDIQKLVVSYYLIQERSSSQHMGLKLGRLNEKNPFSLPTGSGCGLVSMRNLFYVSAVQFSGLFRAKGFANQHYIAYDALTNHLRVDSIHEYKMIYDLKSKLVTYIGDSVIEDVVENHSLNVEDKNHCAQTFLIKSNNENDLNFDAESLGEILGFDKYIGLEFLGNKLLDDGTQVLVYEREVRQIPLITNLYLTKRLRQYDRLFVTYYFVNELSLETAEISSRLLNYKSLWLKKIELTSLNPVTKTKVINAQINFSQFSWSLETNSEDTQKRKSKMMHPVRTFDTIECKSTQSQLQLEFLIKKLRTSELDDKTIDTWAQNTNKELLSQAETFEEAIMLFLTKRVKIPRSQINELELEMPRGNEDKFLLVKSKIVAPMDFRHDRSLIGWFKSVDSFPFEKYGQYIKTQISMTRYECSLALATRLNHEKKVHMVYCPNIGCAHLFALDESLEYIKKDALNTTAPDLMKNYYMCEIYLQTKVLGSDKVLINKFKPETIKKTLDQSQVYIDIDKRSPSDPNDIESGACRGVIVKVATSSSNSDLLGSMRKTGLCYTKKTQLDSQEQSFKIEISELSFDLHHSLIYCHKACQLYPDCQTYSYSKTSRVCTLTNIPESYINSPDESVRLVNLRQNKDCTLYAMNSVHLYKISPIVLFTSLARYYEDKGKRSYFTVSDLNECANLCHSNELNPNNSDRCEKFDYFQLYSICAFQDKSSYLFDTHEAMTVGRNFTDVEKRQKFADLVGRDELTTMNQCYEYERDYRQYYAIEEYHEVKLTEPNEDNPAKGPLLLDLEPSECLRECTLINHKCLMVDHCYHPQKGRYCAMYNVRSPLLINEGKSKLSATSEKGLVSGLNLSELEKMYYLDGASNGSLKISATNGLYLRCTHHYLEGDNLMLKMRFAQMISEKSDAAFGLENSVLAEIENEDRKKSESYKSKFHNYVINDVGIASVLLLLLIGATLGASTTTYGAVLINNDKFKNSFNVISRRVRNRFGYGKKERSLSTVGFNVELTDIN